MTFLKSFVKYLEILFVIIWKISTHNTKLMKKLFRKSSFSFISWTIASWQKDLPGLKTNILECSITMKLSSRRCWSHFSDTFLILKRFNYFRLFCQPQVYVLLVCCYIIFKKLNKVHNMLNTNSFVILNTFLSCLSSLGKFIMIRKIIQVLLI